MRPKLHVALLCMAVLALSLPAAAYLIQGEGIVASSDWQLRTPDTGLDAIPISGVADAMGGAALTIIDSDNENPMDVHAAGNTGDILYTYASTEPFNGAATAVVRMKTTADFPFSDITGTPAKYNWERNIILSFSDGTTWRKCLGLAVRPDAVAFTNTTATTLYPTNSFYAIDNTQWHTWTIVGSGFTSGGGNVALYVDGGSTPVISTFINGTTDTAIGFIDGLSIGGATSGADRDGTGSWMFDWAAVKAGADPAWNPIIPEPGSLLALGGGLIGLAGFGIRRRK